MLVKFKEKTFEKYFGYELARKTKITYSPDQCDEFFLGFDDAFFLPTRVIRALLPYRLSKRWRKMTGVSLAELDLGFDELSDWLPPFKFNLFVQYKRPEFLSRSSALEWEKHNAPYFRYETTIHQQEALEKIELSSKSRSQTIYAAPAFWEDKDLWKHVKSQDIIANSNLASVNALKDHARFTYSKPGCSGIGHSEPVEITSQPIEAMIEIGLRQDEMPLKDHLILTANQIDESLNGAKTGSDNFLALRAYFLSAYEPSLGRPEVGSAAYALATMQAFAEIFEVSLYAFG